MQKDDVCGCCGATKSASRALAILTPAEAEKAAALNPTDLFWRTEAETLLAQVKADLKQAEMDGEIVITPATWREGKRTDGTLRPVAADAPKGSEPLE